MSVEGIQDTTHNAFSAYFLQSLSICFLFTSLSLLPLCIRARVSKSFITLDGLSESLQVPYLFHLMPDFIAAVWVSILLSPFFNYDVFI